MLDLLAGIWLNVDVHTSTLRTYKETYPTKVEQKITKWYNAGGGELDPNELKNTISAVLSKLSFVPDSQGIADLVLETIASESQMGKYVVQKGNGPALGANQMEPKTYKDLHKWMKGHKALYKEVMAFMDNKKDLTYNLKHNLPLQIALTVTHYYRYNGDSLAKRCNNKVMRYMLYKSRYNTLAGACTSSHYFQASKGITQ